MSYESDRQVLEEFEAWREARINAGVDVSLTTFLNEREHEFNAARIAEALRVLNRVALDERASDAEDFAMDALEQARDILQGDRPYDEVRNIADPVATRVYR